MPGVAGPQQSPPSGKTLAKPMGSALSPSFYLMGADRAH